ncbi:uncharacterized protein BO95DRAFT_466672 [Aspergillus brunneoviolaceus CBS 621.78]|uniref:Uncharacterized protein n=1 Tax=Aspergillus brunneoviolaceus CBS 621.78 TaxID=1450534 RepID=A0ACD1G0K8_9EURO|nr:hypothetical protein BO95DRAFT_466672 [Aspergillus brunneoviolaceus CBS 621.78]RAH42728.1 hypothetical protein BO95DRAFT_466672 [Aspergillus brunneoviolaceus CBS 621.78]
MDLGWLCGVWSVILDQRRRLVFRRVVGIGILLMSHASGGNYLDVFDISSGVSALRLRSMTMTT